MEKVSETQRDKKSKKKRRGGRRKSHSVSDQMTLMPLDCRAMWVGVGVYGGRREQRWRKGESADRKRWEEGKGPSCHARDVHGHMSCLKAAMLCKKKRDQMYILPLLRGDEGAEVVKSHQLFETLFTHGTHEREQFVLYWICVFHIHRPPTTDVLVKILKNWFWCVRVLCQDFVEKKRQR